MVAVAIICCDCKYYAQTITRVDVARIKGYIDEVIVWQVVDLLNTKQQRKCS